MFYRSFLRTFPWKKQQYIFRLGGMTSSCSSSSKGNRLGKEKSPYLLQHASNPVDWYPWSEEAFQEARNKDKMIFLSVGYSTCHWCHVMEKESFENEAIAEVMNDLFVNVKVDREERPDVDQVYMSFVTATSGSGGWPMSVFLTPDLKPVFGGTYFPPEDMPWIRRPGFKTVLRSIHSQWINDRPRVTEAGETITKLLEKQSDKSACSSRKIPSSESTAMKVFSALHHTWDPQYGGFSRAPKFPQPVNLNFLFSLIQEDSSSAEHSSERVLQMIRKTLDSMAEGGIWDHVGKGFARYSTDAEWHVPHFEKMLYDQGQLLCSYAQGHFLLRDPKYKRIAEDIVEYVLRDLRHGPSGGFYSGEDADSLIKHGGDEKREGAFCTWTYEEIKALLQDKPEGLFDAFVEAYDIQEDGNTSSSDILSGQNVLRLKRNAKINREHLDESIGILYAYRRKHRPMPHLDDKIISAWNGLMISGLCYAATSLNNEDIQREALKTGDFVLKHLCTEDEDGLNLWRTVYRDKERDAIVAGEVPIHGFIEDYAFIIRGFLDLYDVSLEGKWLRSAFLLMESMDKLFWDEDDGGYFSSRAHDPSIIVRMKNSSDGAEPCGNSVALINILRLAGHSSSSSQQRALDEKASKILECFSEMLSKHPSFAPEMSMGLLFAQRRSSLLIPEVTLRKGMLGTFRQMIPLGSPIYLKEAAPGDKMSFCVKGACHLLGDSEEEALKTLEEIFCLPARDL